MGYGEPPEWSIPVHQEFGVFLPRAKDPATAERIFREDPERFPANGWSLNGLTRSLRDQGRSREAAAAEAEFQRMWEGEPRTASGSS